MSEANFVCIKYYKTREKSTSDSVQLSDCALRGLAHVVAHAIRLISLTASPHHYPHHAHITFPISIQSCLFLRCELPTTRGGACIRPDPPLLPPLPPPPPLLPPPPLTLMLLISDPGGPISPTTLILVAPLPPPPPPLLHGCPPELFVDPPPAASHAAIAEATSASAIASESLSQRLSHEREPSPERIERRDAASCEQASKQIKA